MDGCHKQETQGRLSRWEEPRLAVLACFERLCMLKQRRDNVLTRTLSQCTAEFIFNFITSFLFRNVSPLQGFLCSVALCSNLRRFNMNLSVHHVFRSDQDGLKALFLSDREPPFQGWRTLPQSLLSFPNSPKYKLPCGLAYKSTKAVRVKMASFWGVPSATCVRSHYRSWWKSASKRTTYTRFAMGLTSASLVMCSSTLDTPIYRV